MEREDSRIRDVDAKGDEVAISNWESEGGLVPSHEKLEQGNERGSFIDFALNYCRVVGGNILCKVGDHDFEEIGREAHHGGEDEIVNLRCTRPDCKNPKAWTEWKKGKRVL